MATMLSDLPYMEVDITEHAPKLNFLYMEWLKSVKSASFFAWKTQWKEACLPRPEGGEVEKAGRFFSYYNSPTSWWFSQVEPWKFW